jgi:hypothetical protein
VAAVREAVEGGSGEPFAAEHLGPLFEGQVRRHDQTLPLVGRAEHVKEELGNSTVGPHPRRPAAAVAPDDPPRQADACRSAIGRPILRPGNVPKVGDEFDGMVVWMSEEALVPGKQYLFKQTSKVVPGAVGSLRYRVDINTPHRQPATVLTGSGKTTLARAVERRLFEMGRAVAVLDG